jgi:hypothetical protein
MKDFHFTKNGITFIYGNCLITVLPDISIILKEFLTVYKDIKACFDLLKAKRVHVVIYSPGVSS